MLWARTWALFVCIAMTPFGADAGDTPLTPEQQAQQLTAIALKRRQDLALSISCAQVLDREWSDLLLDHDRAVEPANQENLAKLQKSAKDALDLCRTVTTDSKAKPTALAKEASVMTLVGAGDILVYVPLHEYVRAHGAATAEADVLRLYLNGVNQGDDAKLVSTESLEAEGLAALRFHVQRGKTNRSLWSTIYGSAGLTDVVPLRIGLGWSSIGPVTPSKTFQPSFYVRISDGFAVGLAFTLIVLVLAGSAWVLLCTDAFRDVRTPEVWADARRLRRELKKRVLENRALEKAGAPYLTQEQIRQKLLNSYRSGGKYMAGYEADYEAAARLALTTGVINEDNLIDTCFGLCIRYEPWKPARSTYSLGRVQVGMWLIFAITTGLFLYAVFGCLPDLPPSMLALLTVSAATTGASVMADSAAGGRDFQISRGFLRDLTTGFDSKQQLHRFQAVVVNVMLLFVGIFSVVDELVYPTFDAAWLGFLGLSGVALAGGKQFAEDVKSGGNTDGGADKGGGAGAVAAPNPQAAISATPKVATPPGPTV